MLQHYRDWPGKMRKSTVALVATLNAVVEDYIAQGYRLTVRQLYYQMVARGHIPNSQKSYKALVVTVTNARMAGLMDWDAIEDRTRAFIRRSRWESASTMVESCIDQFHRDLWSNQPCRPFVIVEKEALAGVLERVCTEFDVPLLAARGYPSSTVLREFALSDVMPTLDDAQSVMILHLGDHDPSGLDMSRDLEERISLFAETTKRHIGFKRIALNMRQIREVKPPPNPAKTTDARFAEYRKLHGDESWELDALEPAYLNRLVREHVETVIHPARRQVSLDTIEAGRAHLRAATKYITRREERS